MTKRWQAFGVVIALAGAAACNRGDQGPVAGEEYAGMAADNIMVDLEHHVTIEGVRQAVLRADTGYFYNDSARVELARVHLTMFEKTGVEAADLTADAGELNQRTEAMVARGNVVLVTVQGGRRIETDELHYDPRRHRIWSDVHTVHIEDGSRLEGEGFTAELSADGQLRNLQLREPRGTVPGGRIGF